jgi:predicted DNA-binding protein (UPF0251 family)
MVRPKKKRVVQFTPNIVYFKPRGVSLSQLREVEIGFDELEALRLSDFLNFDQVKSARKMKISQSTFQRILSQARQKMARALVKGLAIQVKGGEYRMPRGFGRGGGLPAGRQGRGRMGGPYAAGPGGECQCTNSQCGYTAVHQPGVPCMQMKCPKCGSPMVRKV